jgi:hypothetical protein
VNSIRKPTWRRAASESYRLQSKIKSGSARQGHGGGLRELPGIIIRAFRPWFENCKKRVLEFSSSDDHTTPAFNPRKLARLGFTPLEVPPANATFSTSGFFNSFTSRLLWSDNSRQVRSAWSKIANPAPLSTPRPKALKQAGGLQ